MVCFPGVELGQVQFPDFRGGSDSRHISIERWSYCESSSDNSCISRQRAHAAIWHRNYTTLTRRIAQNRWKCNRRGWGIIGGLFETLGTLYIHADCGDPQYQTNPA